MPYSIENHQRIKPKKEPTFGKKPYKGKAKNRKGDKKETFYKHERVKPKPSMKNKPKITNADKEYLEYLKGLNVLCFCCNEQNGIEWHHVKEFSNDDKDHNLLIPLCGVKCHRLGDELSAHGTPKKFREKFPIDIQRKFAKSFYEQYQNEMGTLINQKDHNEA